MEQYASIQQLKKKEPGAEGRKNIYPPTPVQAVFDAKTGASLEALLAQVNNIHVPYQGSPQATRCIIPMEMRRQGLVISYVDMQGDTITERANSIIRKDDFYWGLDVHWSRIDELSLTGEISVSAGGTWVINGIDTGVEARGPRGFNGATVLLRNNANQAIEYSYDGDEWFEMFRLETITPKIAVAEPVTLAPGATPTVTNKGDNYYVNLQFGLPAAPRVNVGSVSKVTYNQNPRVYNSGTEYDVVLNFDLQQGVPGAKGDKGDGWTLTGFAATESELPSVGTKGDFYLVGTASPYEAYVHDGTAFRLVGSALEIKAGVFDGGRADSVYGGARTIDCGRADL